MPQNMPPLAPTSTRIARLRRAGFFFGTICTQWIGALQTLGFGFHPVSRMLFLVLLVLSFGLSAWGLPALISYQIDKARYASWLKFHEDLRPDLALALCRISLGVLYLALFLVFWINIPSMSPWIGLTDRQLLTVSITVFSTPIWLVGMWTAGDLFPTRPALIEQYHARMDQSLSHR
jgi:hypothetical protein